MVFQLCEEKRFCEELAEKGYKFNERDMGLYRAELEEKRQEEARKTRNELAFSDRSWAMPLQPRHFTACTTPL